MTPERSPCDTLREHRQVWRSPTEVAAELERIPLLERRMAGLAVYGHALEEQKKAAREAGIELPVPCRGDPDFHGLTKDAFAAAQEAGQLPPWVTYR